ncbi:MAG: NADH-quinone oxidoreductase subunit C [Deltaproteobacteria bacterium]|nr:MAG: NADH-quinone oxidoreductase subunit C [Deltaproteobacteria bacterium]
MAQRVLDDLAARFGDAVQTRSEHGDEIVVVSRDRLVDVATYLRDAPDLAFDAPVFATVIDWLGQGKEPRFEAVWGLRSSQHYHRIQIRVPLDEDDLRVPSLSGLWKGFGWPEREAFDMYGVRYDGHGDLRRILLYEEFVGHPLRKDYPKEKRQPLVRRDGANE